MSARMPAGRAIVTTDTAPSATRPRRAPRGKRAKLLRQIERHVQERKEVWGPTRTLNDAIYVAGIHERKLGHDYEELRKANRDEL